MTKDKCPTCGSNKREWMDDALGCDENTGYHQWHGQAPKQDDEDGMTVAYMVGFEKGKDASSDRLKEAERLIKRLLDTSSNHLYRKKGERRDLQPPFRVAWYDAEAFLNEQEDK